MHQPIPSNLYAKINSYQTKLLAFLLILTGQIGCHLIPAVKDKCELLVQFVLKTQGLIILEHLTSTYSFLTEPEGHLFMHKNIYLHSYLCTYFRWILVTKLFYIKTVVRSENFTVLLVETRFNYLMVYQVINLNKWGRS